VPSKKPYFIFISGGVLSGLGKGATAASLALLLKARGYSVTVLKCENYLNLDSGNINPVEHGDVFLCEDGLEADLDLGSYERFLDQNVGHQNFTTMGQIYSKVIQDGKNLNFDGATIETIPHVPFEVISRIKQAASGYDILLIELGGTAGEYQNALYYEAYRILNLEDQKRVLHVHVTYFPFLKHVGELKSKPTQLSVRILHSLGIQPDFIVGRAETEIDDKRKQKVAFFGNLDPTDVISAPDLDLVYELPLIFHQQNFDTRVLQKLSAPVKKINLKPHQSLIKQIKSPKTTSVSIGIIAKYIKTGDYQLKDSYASLIEALHHAAWYHHFNLNLEFIDAEKLESHHQTTLDQLQSVTGIIVPIGWGSRGVEGKISAITYARTHQVPYLGLCYGMQLAAIEFARNLVGLKKAHTTEVNSHTPHPIIHHIPFDSQYQTIKGDGASMRLGGYDCILKPHTLAHHIYTKHHQFKNRSQHLISERHRHRFEFNNHYRQQLEAQGLVISGTSPDDFFVEIIELLSSIHPFFLATQAHPEYKSRPCKPHGIFIEFLTAAQDNS